ncbi:tail fiber protein, partial [Clostridium sp. 19966]|uniref:tail fiber protein n=1 Tax=Clostridium sp. 19966 TaxID=2768166 RepID=UPI0028DF4381
NLFAAIGTTFGAGDGSTTFNLPDLRGQFIRGFDDGAGVDSGRSFGSGQNDMIKSHRHDFSNGYSGGNWNAGNYGQLANVGNDGSVHPYYVSTTYTGDAETVPKNIALLYCIKY